MVNDIARAICLDASALVKLYVEELGSDIVQKFVNTEPTRYTTPFCYFEALNVLKVKWLYRKEISKEEYHTATLSLTALRWTPLSRQKMRLFMLQLGVFRFV